MANKTIGQLNSMTPSSTTELAIYDGSSTGKATVSSLLDTENLVYADDAMSPGSTAELDFESEDTSLTPSSTTSVDLLQGTDGWSQRFVKVSQMFKNIRWILKKIGSTDITTIDSNGTLTGAISTLNMNLDHNKLHPWVQLIDGIQYAPEGNHVFIRLNITTSVTTSFNTLATLPSGHRPSFNQYFRVIGSNGTGDITILVNTSGNIQAKTDSGTNTAINGFICIA